MWSAHRHESHFVPAAGPLRFSQFTQPGPLSDPIAAECARLTRLGLVENTGPIERLVQAGAWTDAALALIELQLPYWTLRRLILDDGEWLCSLSRQPNLPLEFDEAVEARNEVLALALLSAFAEAKRLGTSVSEVRSPSALQARAATGHAICCDDFA
jgi:hypothetical protein